MKDLYVTDKAMALCRRVIGYTPTEETIKWFPAAFGAASAFVFEHRGKHYAVHFWYRRDKLDIAENMGGIFVAIGES